MNGLCSLKLVCGIICHNILSSVLPPPLKVLGAPCPRAIVAGYVDLAYRQSESVATLLLS